MDSVGFIFGTIFAALGGFILGVIATQETAAVRWFNAMRDRRLFVFPRGVAPPLLPQSLREL